MTEARIGWIALGSNVGPRDKTLATLRGALRQDGVLLITAASPVLLTRALGETRLPDYHNQVLRVEAQTPLHPLAWLRRCQVAERAAGRRPTYRWGPRRADADIVLLGPAGEMRVDEPELRVPHPELRNRPFWCALLASIEPTLQHPDGWLLAGNAGIWSEVAHPRPHV